MTYFYRLGGTQEPGQDRRTLCEMDESGLWSYFGVMREENQNKLTSSMSGFSIPSVVFKASYSSCSSEGWVLLIRIKNRT